MTNWRSVTDILEDMHGHDVPADKAIEWAQTLIAIGKAAQLTADHEARLREQRALLDEVEAPKDWALILGGNK
jgi:hypothetical protein